jgi:hypothetical protein
MPKKVIVGILALGTFARSSQFLNQIRDGHTHGRGMGDVYQKEIFSFSQLLGIIELKKWDQFSIGTLGFWESTYIEIGRKNTFCVKKGMETLSSFDPRREEGVGIMQWDVISPVFFLTKQYPPQYRTVQVQRDISISIEPVSECLSVSVSKGALGRKRVEPFIHLCLYPFTQFLVLEEARTHVIWSKNEDERDSRSYTRLCNNIIIKKLCINHHKKGEEATRVLNR